MDLTNEDVADILALLDSLPYDALDIETPRFRLTLRRAGGGGWTQEPQVLAEPTMATPAPNGDSAPSTAPSDISETSADRAGTDRPGGTGPAREPDAPDELAAVTAPLPGTFYRAPRPGPARSSRSETR